MVLQNYYNCILIYIIWHIKYILSSIIKHKLKLLQLSYNKFENIFALINNDNEHIKIIQYILY